MQPATVPGNTTQEEMNKDTETEQMEQDQENSTVANSAPVLTPQQVADMSDGEVLSNFYLNPTSDLPEDAYQALQNRAGDFANKVRVGNVTPDEMKKTSNALAAQNAKIQKGVGLGEAYSSGRVDTFNEPSWEDMEGHYDEEDSTDDYQNEQVPSIDELRQSSDQLKRNTLLEDLKEAVADRIDDLTNGEYNYNRIYDIVDKYITNTYKKYNTKEIEKYSRVYGGKVDFFAKIILSKYKKQNS